MEYKDIADQLTTWFEPSAHKERRLPGGKNWFYVPHQIITKRLNDICPGHWESKVNQTMISGEFTVIFLELTICGVTRTGVGDSEQPEYNEAGNSKMIGTPAVRAFRSAFKDAAEQHGICAYLDEQTGDKQKFVQYMQKRGDMRAYKNYRDNDWHQTLSNEVKLNTNHRVEDTKYSAAVKSSNGSSPRKISEKQISRMMAIANTNGVSEDELKAIITDFGYTNKKDITYIYGDSECDYERIIATIQKSAVLEEVNTNTLESSVLLSNSYQKISEGQVKRFWAIAKNELNLADDVVKSVPRRYGFDKIEDVSTTKYDEVVEALRVTFAIMQKYGNAEDHTPDRETPVEPVYKSWKSEADAIAWASQQLPECGEDWLKKQFAQLEATNGKKAFAWVQFVQQQLSLETYS